MTVIPLCIQTTRLGVIGITGINDRHQLVELHVDNSIPVSHLILSYDDGNFNLYINDKEVFVKCDYYDSDQVVLLKAYISNEDTQYLFSIFNQCMPMVSEKILDK